MTMNPLLSAAVSHFSADQLSTAYGDPVTACSVYTLLDTCSQSVLDHLLHIDGPMPFAHIRTRHSLQQRADWNKALLGLKQLNILQGRGQEVWVNPVFQRSLIKGICIDARPMGTNTTIPSTDTSVSDYEDSVYKIITNTTTKDRKESKRHKPIMDLFVAGKLIDGQQVTRAGFQFLVQPIHLQLWQLLSVHFATTASIEMWQSIISVCRMQCGSVYKCAKDLQVLVDLFILDANLMPTRLHQQLLPSSPNTANPQNGEQMQIIVETNFHLYAQFPTQLSLAVLSLFTTPKDRLPNLFRGRLTHHSVRSALKRGITADQLCLYLHAHSPTHSPPPTTLLDQMRLWEGDLRRVRTMPDPKSVMYQQFGKQADFEEARRRVREAKLPVLYESGVRRILVVDERGHELLRQFF